MKRATKQDKKPDTTADEVYERIVDYLTEKGNIETVDLEAVRICATIAARVKKYEAIVAKQGEVETYPNGAVAPSAAYKILVQERREFALYCRMLGITPQGRESLTGFSTKKKAKSAAMNLLKLAK